MGARERTFIDTLNNHYLLLSNPFPALDEKILDLVITNAPDLVGVSEVLSAEEAGVFLRPRHCLF